jgi:PRTRC genetic system protein C
MVRIFVYDGREFPDPDSKLTTDQVRSSMANFFPELSNAETKSWRRAGDGCIGSAISLVRSISRCHTATST